MVFHKRKKNTRQRGSHTHGWGSKKKHRGSGNRGGKGMAGTGKKADSKKPLVWKNKKYFGKYGFKPKTSKILNVITLKDLNDKIEKLVEEKLAVKENDVYKINLKELGYDKLLGNGSIKIKLEVTVPKATKKAITVIEENGGKVILEETEMTEEQEETVEAEE